MKQFYLVSNHIKLNILTHHIKNPKGILIHLHGLGSHFQNNTGTYNDFKNRINFFSKISIKSYAVEFEGCGKSDGLRGYISNFNSYINNFKTIYDYIKYKYPNLPLFILAESMGGCVIIKANIIKKYNIDGIILLAPMCGLSKMKISNFSLNCLVNYSYICPKKRVICNNKDIGCNNLKYNIISELNEYDYKYDDIRFSLLRECYINYNFINKNANKFTVPVLAIHSKTDKITCYKKTIEVINKISSQNKELFILDNGHHHLLIPEDNNDIKPFIILSKITNWINLKL
jgi:acylglycerol lipase